ncbi:MAG: thioredoxin domain-containing protein [Bacillota bacterium]
MKKNLVITIIIGLALVVAIGLPALKARNTVIEATINPEEKIDQALAEGRPIFIEFYADRCPSCVKMKPIIEELQKAYGTEIQFILADTDNEGYNLAAQLKVMYIPSYVFVDADGQQRGQMLSGVMSKNQLESLLIELL